jgi:hypothetical protein
MVAALKPAYAQASPGSRRVAAVCTPPATSQVLSSELQDDNPDPVRDTPRLLLRREGELDAPRGLTEPDPLAW